MTELDRAHLQARERGERSALYALARFLLAPPLRLWFRMRISGAEYVPADGPAIIAPNHKSFLDAFFVAIAIRRHVRYMAKTELIEGPLGGLFLTLGAFPVRRGQADAQAIATARMILEQGELLVIFPEGTRVEDPDALGSPHHGAGRLALQTGAPIVPAAITGTDHLWLGPILKPRRVELAFLEPLDPLQVAGRPDAVAELVDRECGRRYGSSTAASSPDRVSSSPRSPGWVLGPAYLPDGRLVPRRDCWASSHRARCAGAKLAGACWPACPGRVAAVRNAMRRHRARRRCARRPRSRLSLL